MSNLAIIMHHGHGRFESSHPGLPVDFTRGWQIYCENQPVQLQTLRTLLETVDFVENRCFFLIWVRLC